MSPEDAVKELARLRQLAAACVNAKHAGKRVKDELNLDHYKAKKANLPPEIKSLITSVMDSNILFKRCKAEEKEELLANFEACEYASGEVIIKAGDQGDCFYIIQTGSCDIFLPNNEIPVAKCTAGNSFGELALMYDTPRAATVKSTCPVKAWKIARQAYRLILAYHAVQRSNEHMAILKEVVLVSSDQQEKKMLKDCLSEPQLRKLADAMDEDVVHAGDAILRDAPLRALLGGAALLRLRLHGPPSQGPPRRAARAPALRHARGHPPAHQKCWDADPNRRPAFDAIVDTVDRVRDATPARSNCDVLDSMDEFGGGGDILDSLMMGNHK